jgi:hypothetical protein
MEVSGQPHAPAALPQRKSPWYPLDRMLGGPQSRSPGRTGKDESEVGGRGWTFTRIDLGMTGFGPERWDTCIRH